MKTDNTNTSDTAPANGPVPSYVTGTLDAYLADDIATGTSSAETKREELCVVIVVRYQTGNGTEMTEWQPWTRLPEAGCRRESIERALARAARGHVTGTARTLSEGDLDYYIDALADEDWDGSAPIYVQKPNGSGLAAEFAVAEFSQRIELI